MIGVDAGGSKIRVLDASGRTATTSPGTNLASDGADEAARRLVRALSELGGDPRAVAISIAGGRTSARNDALRQVVQKRLGIDDVFVFSDIDSAIGAVEGGPAQLVLIAGTGATAATGYEGVIQRVSGGFGHLLGEPGSGFWLGSWLHRAVVEQSETRHTESRHVPALLAYWGVSAVHQIPEAVASSATPVMRLASFARMAIECARDHPQGCEIGCATASVKLIDDLVGMAVRSAEASPEPVRAVGLAGGLFESAWFRERVSEVLAARLPTAAISTIDPALGAKRLALRALEADQTDRVDHGSRR